MLTMTLRQLASEMKHCFDRAPSGPNCAAWWRFINSCRLHYQTEPLSAAAESLYPPQWFTTEWMKVANGESPEYHPETGEQLIASSI